MPDRGNDRVLNFVWHPRKITPEVFEMARATASGIICDLSQFGPDLAAGVLPHAGEYSGLMDLKIHPDSLMAPGLAACLKEHGIARVWVELHPHLVGRNLSEYLDRAAELTVNHDVIPVVGSLELIGTILHSYPQLGGLALKGNEAAGFVSSETIFVLYATLRDMIRKGKRDVGLYIWGGIGTPEAAAAFLAVGAKGIVFESLHWLTDLVSMNDQLRRRLSSLRPDHTEVVGSNLGTPCRLFNKGNSTAVKRIKDLAGKLWGAGSPGEIRGEFCRHIQEKAIRPLESGLGRDEVIPLGVEAAFAASFVRRFGSATGEAAARFKRAIDGHRADAGRLAGVFVDSPVAKEMGTQYPFIQGAMTWISDVPEFARQVAEAGGLPTIALGMMDWNTLEAGLGNLPDSMGGAPYAVNVITLPENPRRDEQLSWIRRRKPRFAVIAAGAPEHARELLKEGVEVFYIAPSEDLLRMALDVGVRYVICEGNEAGGHVGQYSTITMAQIVVDLKDREPALFDGRKVVLAGGICNRETAFMAAMLGADALQMGTAYLATKEIVTTGALAELYQRMIIDAGPGSTIVTGEATGLRVRSLKNEKIEAIMDLERRFAAGSEDEQTFRSKIEALAVGSLLIAARGSDRPGGAPLSPEQCKREGQFMSGACAGILTRDVSIRELHRELAEGEIPVSPEGAPARELAQKDREAAVFSYRAGRPQPHAYERIAITGMSIVNSLGNSPEEVWAASLALKSGIVAVPASRWNHDLYYDPKPQTPMKTYCRVGAFHNLEISRKDIGVPPQDFRSMIHATKMTLLLAHKAIDASGILTSDIPPERVSVLVSQNAGEVASTLQDIIIRGLMPDLLTTIKKVVPLSSEAATAVEKEILSGRLVIDDTTLLGRLNSAAVGFISDKFGFRGPSYAVSTACATSLTAIFAAVQMIYNGLIDAAIIGGGEERLSPWHFVEFSAIGALAGYSGAERTPAEMSRPFDADRDGMVLGEGGGMIVIERESLARKRGSRIYGYITSVGASNNNLGMVESSRVSQEIAIRASFEGLHYGPECVDMIECHATSTRQGDVEEVLALRNTYGPDKKAVLTSFKSQIGHTLGASGINSLIRGVMAMNAGVYPPTLNYARPDPAMGIEGSGFTICREPEDWRQHPDRPRRFQVSAFGFGGSNYVIQVEEARHDRDVVLHLPDDVRQETFSEALQMHIPDGIHLYRAEEDGQGYRIALVDDSQEKALERLRESQLLGKMKAITPKRLKGLSRQGIHIGFENEPALPIAFVFPGQGSHYAGMGLELYQNIPIIRQWMDRAQGIADFDLLNILFYSKEDELKRTRWQQPALFVLEYAIAQHLSSLGVTPKAVAGHSVGEITALCFAGVFSFEDGFGFFNKRAIAMDSASRMVSDPGGMLAVRAPLDFVNDIVSQWEGVHISNINSPSQVVIGGRTKDLQSISRELKRRGYANTMLRVSMAFHTPILECIHEELREFLAEKQFHPPRIPVISNTTMKLFPSDVDEIRRIMVAHTSSTVHWMQNVQALWNDYGVRLYVEVGPKDVLSDLIPATIEDADCIQTCLPSAEELVYMNALASLYSRGHLKTLRSPALISALHEDESFRMADSGKITASGFVQAPRAVSKDVADIVQREINSFVIQFFGRFVRPSIVAALKREQLLTVSDRDLDRILAGLYPEATSQETPVVKSELSTVGSPFETARETFVHGVSDTGEASGSPMPQVEDITESIIKIIMDVTGYERNEIDADMSLRDDLSIRSSRLPVVMDALEGHFGITIRMEDFMNVSTIRDVSDKIAVLIRKGDKESRSSHQTGDQVSVEVTEAPSIPEEREGKDVKRFVLQRESFERADFHPVDLQPFDSLAVVSLRGARGLANEVASLLKRDFGCDVCTLSLANNDEAVVTKETRGSECAGVSELAKRLREMEALSGVIFTIDGERETAIDNVAGIADLLGNCFELLKAFLESPARRFALLLQRQDRAQGGGYLLAEGVLGIFLSAVRELGSVLFRVVRLDEVTELRVALRDALNMEHKPVEIRYERDRPYVTEARISPILFQPPRRAAIEIDDVWVISGGGYGITSFLSKALSNLGCRIAVLGRTVIEKGDDRATMVMRTIDDLRAGGSEVSYFGCDVTDTEQTADVIDQILRRYGKVSGIIHGAGILRDSLLEEMTVADFSAVVNTKFLGAWNLLRGAENAGLKFFVCLSSVASISGNAGQANYAAANRVMTALIEHLHKDNLLITFKSLVLSPVEGAGMADTPELRSVMRRLGMEYITPADLCELFLREMFFSSRDDVSVIFLRSFKEIDTAPKVAASPLLSDDEIHSGAMSFRKTGFPMIDSVTSVDYSEGRIRVARTFSHDKDLWIQDHKPYRFLKYPLLSAIMMLETVMEAAKLLYPYLNVYGVGGAQFLEILDCPAEFPRPCEISARTLKYEAKEILCEAVFEAREMSPSGRLLDRTSPICTSSVLLSSDHQASSRKPRGLPVSRGELDDRGMNSERVLASYRDHFGFGERYRVITDIEGSSEDAIRGHMVYREHVDFSISEATTYQYSPYLLEALLQIASTHSVLRSEDRPQPLIPREIGEMFFSRKCIEGERLALEARLLDKKSGIMRWNARAVDELGNVIMVVENLMMRQLSVPVRDSL